MAGSIWPEDEEHLFPALLKILEEEKSVRLVLVQRVDVLPTRIFEDVVELPVDPRQERVRVARGGR